MPDLRRAALSPIGAVRRDNHHAIAIDKGEKARRNIESEIQKGMMDIEGSLLYTGEQNKKPLSNKHDFDAQSFGFGDLSDAESHRRHARRARVDDASSTSASSDDEYADGGAFSVRLARLQNARGSLPRSPLRQPTKSPGRSTSAFAGMAKELRKEFDRISALKPDVPPRPHSPAPILRKAPVQSSPLSYRAPSQPQLTVPNNSKATESSLAPKHAVRRSISSSHASPNMSRTSMRLPDVTGLTEGLASPERPASYRTVSAPQFRQNVEDARLTAALENLRDRIYSLERENEGSADKIRDLEQQLLDQKRAEIKAFEQIPQASQWEAQLSREKEERRALEDLVDRLRSHVTRLNQSLNGHADLIDQLQSESLAAQRVAKSPSAEEWKGEVGLLRQAVEALSGEVDDVRSLVQGILQSKSTPKPTRDVGINVVPTRDTGVSPIPEYKQRRATPTHHEQTPKSRVSSHTMIDHLEPQMQKAEAILRNSKHNEYVCSVCQKKKRRPSAASTRRRDFVTDDEGYVEGEDEEVDVLLPQAALSRRLHELEKDFEQHKALYIELSDSYRAMDPAVMGTRRKMLAEHLKESIDLLEIKADEIKRLYGLLHYKGSK